MIIRCQNGGLLESIHVVNWDVVEDSTKKGRYMVIAKTVLDTDCEVFRGNEPECEDYRDWIQATLSEEPRMLRQLCDGLKERDEKLAAALRRLIEMNKR